MTEKELGALYYNDYDTNLEFGEFCYNKGRADRDKEIAENNVFFSNRPIEDIVLETRTEVIEKFAEFLKKKHLLTNFHYRNGEADFDYADIDGYVNEFKNQIKEQEL